MSGLFPVPNDASKEPEVEARLAQDPSTVAHGRMGAWASVAFFLLTSILTYNW